MSHIQKILHSLKEKYISPDYARLQNEDDFRVLAEMLALLTDYEMRRLRKSNDDVIDKMPILISLVNTLGFLRGQHGAFRGLSIRDDDLRTLIRKNEIKYENRLGTFILNNIKGEGMKERYKRKLTTFFVDFRCSK